MRITNNMMSNILLNNLSTNLQNLAKLQEINSDGRRVHRPSDDPVAISSILKLKTDLGELDQYEKNIKDALSWYEVTESSVIDLSNAVERMRELAVQANNTGTNNPDDLKKIKSEIEELKRHVIAAGNFNYAGKFIFSGHQNDRALFKTEKVGTEEVTTYNVDITHAYTNAPDRLTYMVSQSERIQVTANGLDLFGFNPDVNTYSSMMTDTSGSNFKEGISVIQGRFNPNLDYTGDTLDITVNGVVYNVNEAGLDGTIKPVDKRLMLQRLREASSGGGLLQDVANIYYDDNENLVISAKNEGEAVTSASANMKLATTKVGVSAKKSELKGTFALTGPESDYRTKSLDITIGGKNYAVDESELTGHGFDLPKEKVLKALREAKNGSEKLGEVADIFFDQDNMLVIKEKKYGNRPIALTGAAGPGFTPVLTRGNDSEEASVDFSDFVFDDTYIANNQAKLKLSPIYINHNGTRTRVSLDEKDVVDTVDKYRASLQKAIDKNIGTGKIEVDTTGGRLKFTTKNTPDGTRPEIYIEPVITNESSLLNDIDKFIKALDTSNKEELNNFLGNIDKHKDRILAVRADLGAKTSRMELALERTKDNRLSFTGSLSNVEHVDLAESIMKFKNLENVYNASLSIGGKIIQPSLVDFIR